MSSEQAKTGLAKNHAILFTVGGLVLVAVIVFTVILLTQPTRSVAKTVVKKARTVVKKAKTVAKKAVKSTVKAVAKYGTPANLVVAVATVGVCAATAGVGCLVATGASVVIGGAIAGISSYNKHGSIKRAAAQAGGSVALDLISGAAFGKIAKAAFGTSRIGNTAVNMHGIPFVFSGGLAVEALIDKGCSKSGAC